MNFSFYFREARSVLSVLQHKHGLREYAQIIVAKFPPELVALLAAPTMGSFSAASCIIPNEENLVRNDKYLVRSHHITFFSLQYHIIDNIIYYNIKIIMFKIENNGKKRFQ